MRLNFEKKTIEIGVSGSKDSRGQNEDQGKNSDKYENKGMCFQE